MSINASFAPVNETSADIWLEQANFIGLTSLGSVTWGIMFTIWVLCLDCLLPRLFNAKTAHKRDWFHLFYVTLMCLLAAIGNFAGVRVAQLTYIDNRNFPGGPNAFTVQYYNLPVNIAGNSAFTVATWFQDGYQVYRLLVFWNFNYYIALFPVLVYMGSIATSCVFLHEAAIPGGNIWTKFGLDFITAFYMLSIFLNVIITILIVGKVLWSSKTIRHVLGHQHAKMYTSVIAMLIESAGLYSITGIVFVGLFLRNNTAQFLFLPVLGGVGTIAPSLIIYRVASGRAWSRKAMQQVSTGIGTLQFAPRPDHLGKTGTSTIPLTTLGSFTDMSKGSTAFGTMQRTDKSMTISKESSV